jgi:ligand-binding sensor domain-containing protein
MKFKKYLVLVLFCLFTSVSFGQEQGNSYTALKFKNISLKKEFFQSSVLGILQDRKGFLWFGTRDGLNKYDGNKFFVYRHHPKDITFFGFSNEVILSVIEPSLSTSINQSGIKIGKTATHLLLSQINSSANKIVNKIIILPTDLIERKSSKKIMVI